MKQNREILLLYDNSHILIYTAQLYYHRISSLVSRTVLSLRQTFTYGKSTGAPSPICRIARTTNP